MHASSLENMRRCIDWYLPEGRLRVADLGSANVNGSYRDLLPADVDYTGFDLEAGPGVDVVLDDPYHLPLEDSSADLILSGQMLEHCGQFWRVFNEIERVLKPGGLAFIIAPSTGPVHRYPVDCYRFYPDSYAAIAEWAGLRLVHAWTAEEGPWQDMTGVFQKGGSLQAVTAPPAHYPAVAANIPPGETPFETVSGERPYLDVLKDLHEILKPKRYLEIGVRHGRSLALSQARTIAIDPEPASEDFGSNVDFYRCTSDDFFFFHADRLDGVKFDLAFIDGMHLAENVLRDFIQTERRMRKSGAIVIDDVLPNHPEQATRDRRTRVWTGDVWRFAAMLEEERPDLTLTWLDTAPSGLLLVTGLSPASKHLMNRYNPIARKLADTQGNPVPAAVLERQRAISPAADTLRRVLRA
ncbi:MAG: methyltransferase domain-containing protein [Glycocaulis sp.]